MPRILGTPPRLWSKPMIMHVHDARSCHSWTVRSTTTTNISIHLDTTRYQLSLSNGNCPHPTAHKPHAWSWSYVDTQTTHHLPCHGFCGDPPPACPWILGFPQGRGLSLMHTFLSYKRLFMARWTLTTVETCVWPCIAIGSFSTPLSVARVASGNAHGTPALVAAVCLEPCVVCSLVQEAPEAVPSPSASLRRQRPPRGPVLPCTSFCP